LGNKTEVLQNTKRAFIYWQPNFSFTMKIKKTLSSINTDFRWILGTSLLFLIIIVLFFRFSISYNEMDVIPYAKALFNNDWLKNDWYLSLKIPYRYFFSYPVGFFVDTFGFANTIIVGRIISYILIAIALNALIRSLKVKSNNYLFYFALILFFIIFPSGYGANEWMAGGLETKVFAYGFAILSLSSFLNKQNNKGFLFAGLALSFHLLVGLYNLFCLIPVLWLHQSENRNYLIGLFKSLPIFIIAGSVGIYGILYQLSLPQDNLNNIGWDIYVNIRVPHHTLPSMFPIEIWIKFIIFALLNLFFFIKSKNKEVRMLSSYAIFSVIISLIGLLFFLIWGADHHLKYYFFRFGSIMLPLISFLNIISFTIGKSEHILSKNHNKIKYTFMALSFTIMLPAMYFFISDYAIARTNRELLGTTSPDIAMADWIKQNTPKSKVFITKPNDMFFYLNYERPVFVTSKHAPQSGKDIVEWYNRLKALNGGKDFENGDQLDRNFPTLSEEELLGISAAYPNVAYVLMPQSVNLDFPVLFKSKINTLYEIRKPED